MGRLLQSRRRQRLAERVVRVVGMLVRLLLQNWLAMPIWRRPWLALMRILSAGGLM